MSQLAEVSLGSQRKPDMLTGGSRRPKVTVVRVCQIPQKPHTPPLRVNRIFVLGSPPPPWQSDLCPNWRSMRCCAAAAQRLGKAALPSPFGHWKGGGGGRVPRFIYTHTYIRTYIPYIHTYIPTFLYSCIPTFLHPTLLHSYIPTFLHSYIHTFIHSYIPTFLHSYIHTFMHRQMSNASAGKSSWALDTSISAFSTFPFTSDLRTADSPITRRERQTAT